VKKSISEIKAEFENSADTDAMIDIYSGDERKGVADIINYYRKKQQNYKKELERLEKMYEYENKYYSDGAVYIAGIDEVGRGPLAGPVMTASVILPKNLKIPYVNDSKKLSAKKREELYDIILDKALAVSVRSEENTVIDEINILQATLLAMKKSIEQLSIRPDVILADAVTIPNIDIKQEKIIKGDAKSHSIAAASIVAKVTRDRLMCKYAKMYPEYGFDRNSGYGTKEHIDAIKKYGITPIHRKSFLGNIKELNL
jgi:ribonuclease HII